MCRNIDLGIPYTCMGVKTGCDGQTPCTHRHAYQIDLTQSLCRNLHETGRLVWICHVFVLGSCQHSMHKGQFSHDMLCVCCYPLPWLLSESHADYAYGIYRCQVSISCNQLHGAVKLPCYSLSCYASVEGVPTGICPTSPQKRAAIPVPEHSGTALLQTTLAARSPGAQPGQSWLLQCALPRAGPQAHAGCHLPKWLGWARYQSWGGGARPEHTQACHMAQR